MERGLAVGVEGIDVGACLDQEQGNVFVALLGSVVEGRGALVVDILASQVELCDDVQVPRLCGQKHGGLARHVGLAQGSACFDEGGDDACLARAGGQRQRRPPVGVYSFDVCPCLEEDRDDVLVPSLGGHVERSCSKQIALVHGGACSDQSADDGGPSRRGCPVQQRGFKPVHSLVHTGALLDEHGRHLVLVVDGCRVER